MSRVLIHGFTGSPASWDPVGVAGERVTLLGHGVVDGATSWDEEIDRLAALVPDGAHVCGYSLGGRMVLALLARGRVGRATLISTSAGLDGGRSGAGTDESARAERLAGDERWAQLAERDLERFLDEWEAQPLFATQRRLPAERLAAQRATRGAHTGAGLARSLRTVGLARMPNLWGALATFDVPVDVVAGALDEKYVAHARRMASLLPRARLTIVPDAGHNLLLEAPAAIAAILGVKIERVERWLAGTVPAGRARVGAREALIIRLSEGVGECSPLPGYSPDTIDECEAELCAGEARSPAARFALEMAQVDLDGKRAGVAAHRLLAGAPIHPVAISALLPAGDELRVAREAVAAGIGCLKLKVGGDLSRDVALVRALRDELGPGVRLRLDANGAWSPPQARAAIEALVPLSPELIEEPTRDWRELQLPSAIPIAMDESLQHHAAELEERAARGACAAIVLKPMALGGFAACLSLARRAAAVGAGVIVTHLFDGPIALAAAAELALAIASFTPPWPCGLAPHAALDGPPPPQIAGAFVVPSGKPGLGL